MSAEEVEDLDKAKHTLDHYEKIYNIFEYSTEITRLCNMIETRVTSNNPSFPMNIYRWSKSSSMPELFPEIEKALEAYYNLIDDCKEHPDWQKKL